MRAGFAALIVAYVFSQFYRAFLAVLAPVLGTDIGATPADLAFASGVWFAVFAAMQIPVGHALDTVGPRRTCGWLFVLAALGAAVFAMAPGPAAVTLAMALIGAGCSAVLMASLYIFARVYPPAVFASLSGLVIGAGSAGNIASAAPMAWVVEAGRRFRRAGGRIAAAETDAGPVDCADVILATGVETPDICRPLGFAPQIYPVKGYSGTWTILRPERIPRLPFIDETELLAVASYGDRLRVTAIAEFAGRDWNVPENRTALLDSYVRRNFGDAVDLETPNYWAGLRPSTPAGPPYLGRVRKVENLWINAGHGQLGWTMALGSGEILAELVTGGTPAVSDVSARARWLEAA